MDDKIPPKLFDRCGYYVFENAKGVAAGKSAPPCIKVFEFLLNLKKEVMKSGTIQHRFEIQESITKFMGEIDG